MTTRTMIGRVLALVVLVGLLACGTEATAPDANIPRTEQQTVTPTKAVLETMDRLNADLVRFYRDGGEVVFMAVIALDRETGAPVLQLSLRHPSLPEPVPQP